MDLFQKFSLWDSLGLFFPYSGHIEDTKSVEFASVAIFFQPFLIK